MEKPKTSSSSLQSIAIAFFFFFFLLNAHAQSLPPAKFDGFVYGNHSHDLDTILIEAFYDPVCPDSRDSWPPLKKALDHYGSRVRLVIHLLPLPWVQSIALLCVSVYDFRWLIALFCCWENFCPSLRNWKIDDRRRLCFRSEFWGSIQLEVVIRASLLLLYFVTLLKLFEIGLGVVYPVNDSIAIVNNWRKLP